MHWNIDSSWICFLSGPEDDLIKVEKCRPDDILILLYIEQNIVLLTDTLYLYNTSGWKILKKDVQADARMDTLTST